MARKKKVSSDTWDDEPKTVKPLSKAQRETEYAATHAAIARQARKAGSRGLPVDDLIGEPSSDDLIGEPSSDDLIGDDDIIGDGSDLIGDEPFSGARLKAVSVERGVYMDHHRSSAIVIENDSGRVEALYLRSSGIEKEVCSEEHFAHDFIIALPHYPLRRAARIYSDSPIPKSESARRALRALLHA
jgi:hypothetical protein